MRKVYLDNNATTAMWPEAFDAMREAACEAFANPSSVHDAGTAAAVLLERARVAIAGALGIDVSEIVLTSGGTESTNIALRGILSELPKKQRQVVTSSIEHPAILQTLDRMAEEKLCTVKKVDPDSEGVVSAESIEKAITAKTGLVCLMLANNETGVLQPAQEVGATCHEREIVFFCDPVQAVGKIPVDLKALNASVAPFSAHKFHGPKGVGMLYVQEGIRIPPHHYGGGQEGGVRPGTSNVMGAVGMAEALLRTIQKMNGNASRVAAMRDKLQEAILDINRKFKVHGEETPRLPNTLNVMLKGFKASDLVRKFSDRGIAVSAGSACSSKNVTSYSHVLLAMGDSEEEAASSLRLSLGYATSDADIDYVIAVARELLAS